MLSANSPGFRPTETIPHQPATKNPLTFSLQIGARMANTKSPSAVVELQHKKRFA